LTPQLPLPARTRWQPLRIGLVDLFYYDTEEFWFRDGRLLLRGNNGTGKSKVLALTLPFLLDGDLKAHRVEPDGDPKKRMEWNLLLGGEHPHPERLGYTWIEFGRLDAAGQPVFKTLGCGLKAAKGRGMVRHWFFVTDQRVGDGLSLLDATGSALSRDRLAEAVEGHGLVYDQARAYRRAVDEALFGLGEQRYGALVDLLVQLRQPQLSKRPSEKALSKALTEALPPMDIALISDVAEAFRSLDEEKDNLVATAEARDAAVAFLGHYRRYARTAARRKARLPRLEQSRYEHLRRDLNQAQEALAGAEERIAAAETAQAELDERRVRLRAEDEALRAGPEMRSARELEQAAADADRTRRDADRTTGDRDRAAAAHSRALTRLAQAQARREQAELVLDGTLAEAREAAGTAGIAAAHREAVEGPARETGPAEVAEAELRRAADELAARRRRAVGHLETLLSAQDRAEAERGAAARRHEDAESELLAAAERREQARTEAVQAGAELVSAVRHHLAGCERLRPADPEGLLERLTEWTAHLEGPYPARTEADAAHRAAAAELAAEEAALGLERSAVQERRRALDAELAALEAGGQRGPAAPHTRGAAVRDGMPGAPLWRLVDFHDGVPEAVRAGLEAALEAAGLLDAWVCPDGAALDPYTHDVLLAPDATSVDSSLAQVLRPAVDHGDPQASAVAEETVARLLGAIGFGEQPEQHAQPAHSWADGDGRFRLGVLRGAWTKDRAEYLGEGAREEARRARIAAVRDELAVVTRALQELSVRVRETADRRLALDAELVALPDDAPLRQAHARTVAADEAVRRARARQEAYASQLAEAARVAGEAASEAAEAAADLDLPADRAGLRTVQGGLDAYGLALAALWPAVRERSAAARTEAAERDDAREAAARVEELAERAEDAARLAAAAAQRHETLAATVGTAVAELQRRLAEVGVARTACESEERRARREHTEAVRAQGEATGRIGQLSDDVAEAARARDEAVAALQRFAATGLLAVALPELEVPGGPGGDEPWAARPAVELARTVDAELAAAGTDDSDGAWERVQRRTNDELKNLQDALSRHGHSASGRMLEDGLVVDILFQGRERAVPELAAALDTEVAELQRMLSAREREILENHLVTEVAGTLQELIGAAERQVLDMNEELADRPTSTGMRLRLVWQPSREAPPGFTAARERLRQSADAWSAADRSAIGDFLQAEIARAQSEQSTGTWLDHLTAALDYRSWHEFGIERHQHGQWRTATGPASGGERVLAVSVPLFAAASSHYATAGHPYAPRLVTLDEAFAGVDDDSRAKCLGLLHAFDLDVVMTSEREWACYPQVPGVAIAQLSRVDEIAAVLVTRWEWDGHERMRGTEPERAGTADSVLRDATAADQDGLWTPV
jgi:uncharacterized protein (TIGR02680 family)